jgi:outer membrane protein assembly factor BamB
MRYKIRLASTLVSALLVFAIPGAAQSAKNWAQFRGPQGSGIAADGPALPVEFNDQKNLIWKTGVGKGNSSPCVWGNRIFLTAYEEKTLQTFCLDKETGKQIWERRLPSPPVNMYGTASSPILAGGRFPV